MLQKHKKIKDKSQTEKKYLQYVYPTKKLLHKICKYCLQLNVKTTKTLFLKMHLRRPDQDDTQTVTRPIVWCSALLLRETLMRTRRDPHAEGHRFLTRNPRKFTREGIIFSTPGAD